jgi:ABC-type multidrug transport system ATPase subunit
LIADDIVHRYGSVLALRNLSFHLKKGEIIGVLGHNGCGKSTAFKIVAGETHQSSGVLSFLGVDKGLMNY